VDVAQVGHLDALLDRGEVIEIDGETAAQCGWQGYVHGVRVWRLRELAE